MDDSCFAHINTHDNWADFLTKVTSRPKQHDLVCNVLYDIYDYKQQQDQSRNHDPLPDLEGTETIYPDRRRSCLAVAYGVRHEKALWVRESSASLVRRLLLDTCVRARWHAPGACLT